MTIQGRLFDGRSSRPLAVSVAVAERRLVIAYPDGRPSERLPADLLRWHEPLGGAVRRVDLPDGRFCELPHGKPLNALLCALNHRESAVVQWQGSAFRALLAGLLVLALALAGYRWGVPASARAIAAVIPQQALAELDSHVLTSMRQGGYLESTKLPAEQRRAIRSAARALELDAGADAARLHFFAAPGLGANAFALPGGTVVITDELVEVAPAVDHVAAVVAHELGHVTHRHGVRNMIQASLLAAALGVLTGDFSSLVAVGGTALLNSAYSRDFEFEADAHGAALLQRSGQSPALLAEMLEALSESHGEVGDEPAMGRYLSSHPATPERVRRLRAMR